MCKFVTCKCNLPAWRMISRLSYCNDVSPDTNWSQHNLHVLLTNQLRPLSIHTTSKSPLFWSTTYQINKFLQLPSVDIKTSLPIMPWFHRKLHKGVTTVLILFHRSTNLKLHFYGHLICLFKFIEILIGICFPLGSFY